MLTERTHDRCPLCLSGQYAARNYSKLWSAEFIALDLSLIQEYPLVDSPLLSFMRRNDSGARPLDNGDVGDDDWFHDDCHLEPILVRQIILSASNYSATIAHYVYSILHQSKSPDSFSWACTIRFFTQHGQFKGAFAHYVQMQRMSVISIHGQVQKFGFCGGGGGIYMETALVDFDCKLGDMEISRKMFEEMAERNVVSWHSMLAGCLKSGYLAVAQRVFDEIPQKDNLLEAFFDAMPQRNSASWMTMISGYSKCGDVDSACELFDQVGGKDLLLFNAVIACYAQNSKLKEGLKLFNMMLHPNVNVQPDEEEDLVANTAMILGCGINGKAIDAIKLFDEMVDAQICPNLIMFTGLLTTYNHSGQDGYMKLIKSMPMQPHAGVWGALLFACRLHNNADLGEIAAQHFFELEPDTTGYCSLPCNIYVSGERLDDIRRLRKIRKEKTFSKYLFHKLGILHDLGSWVRVRCSSIVMEWKLNLWEEMEICKFSDTEEGIFLSSIVRLLNNTMVAIIYQLKNIIGISVLVHVQADKTERDFAKFLGSYYLKHLAEPKTLSFGRVGLFNYGMSLDMTNGEGEGHAPALSHVFNVH
ncbi:Pentatricopeptide repeat-containing protein [Vitis vinifera]|uniref:Pentatricopeptide repeat-containing protein n=1 Tax=Vitis vinifera TaxID=29760 RepID=A0A438EYL4_VITVI|nr:Pentatricopeptide repeat-containing protein [Vitis vinifera]